HELVAQLAPALEQTLEYRCEFHAFEFGVQRIDMSAGEGVSAAPEEMIGDVAHRDAIHPDHLVQGRQRGRQLRASYDLRPADGHEGLCATRVRAIAETEQLCQPVGVA